MSLKTIPVRSCLAADTIKFLWYFYLFYIHLTYSFILPFRNVSELPILSKKLLGNRKKTEIYIFIFKFINRLHNLTFCTVKKATSDCAKFRCWQRWHRTKRRGSRNFPTPTSFGSRHRCSQRNFAKLFYSVIGPEGKDGFLYTSSLCS